MIKKITTNLMVEDVDKSVNFYKEMLGFSLVLNVPNEEGGSQFAIISLNDMVLMLQQRTSMMVEYKTLKRETINPSVSLFIDVTNFMELYNSLKSSHQIHIDIHNTFYGSKEFSILDIDGYVLTFNDVKNNSNNQ